MVVMGGIYSFILVVYKHPKVRPCLLFKAFMVAEALQRVWVRGLFKGWLIIYKLAFLKHVNLLAWSPPISVKRVCVGNIKSNRSSVSFKNDII
jgi:hypothetical protein